MKLKLREEIKLITLFIILLFTACSKDNNNDGTGPDTGANGNYNPSNTKPDIYLAGFELTDSGINAKYWKNGAGTVLGKGIATSLYVSDSDVYVAGYDVVSSGRSRAIYYKNGKINVLTDDSQEAKTCSIYASASNVIVAGYIFNGSYKVITLWIDDTPIALSGGTTYANVFSMAIYGSDIYVLGNEYNGSKYVIKYWKYNGQVTSLSDAQYATSIFQSGSDTYVSGSERNSKGISEATYWKNGIATVLGNGKGDLATAIYASGKNVYVAGIEDKGTGNGDYLVKYWKNGIPYLLNDAQAYAGTFVSSSIYVNGNDLYIAGFGNTNANGIDVAMYWKNGVAIPLSDGTLNEYVTSLFVKE
jgi:hypothetical protein